MGSTLSNTYTQLGEENATFRKNFTKSANIRLLVVGKTVFIFGAAPGLQMVSWLQSSCAEGPPDYVYIVLGLQMLFTGFHIYLALSRFKPVEGWKFPPPMEACVADYLHRGYTVVNSMEKTNDNDQRSWSDRLLSFWPMLTWLAILDVSDLTTDVLLPGQLQACENVAVTRLYTNSWEGWGLVQSAVDRLHLSGLIFVFMLSTCVVQTCVVLYHLWRSWNIHEVEMEFDVLDEDKCRRLTECWSDFAVVAGSAGGDVLGKIYLEALARIPTEKTRPAAIALQKKLARDTPAMADDETPEAPEQLKSRHITEAIGGEQAGRKLAVFYRSVVVRILLEAAPSMLGAVAVFAEAFDTMALPSKIKTMLTLSLSALTCCHAAFKCFKFASSKRWDAFIVGMLILCLIAMAVVKVAYAFICPHRFFQVFGWHCTHNSGA